MNQSAPGALYVVATPIGNLEDITDRARAVLTEVDLILAEDTRHSRRLLRAYGIETPMRAMHDHNERRISKSIVARIEVGERVALISDAGTPLLSDPGFFLVRELRRAGLAVVPVPGPSALACALSVASVPVERFAFEGFLPAKAAARKRRLLELVAEPRTLVFYEAPHRLLETLEQMHDIFGSARRIMLAKELTKRHETVLEGSPAELRAWLREDDKRQRGEFVLMVEGSDVDPSRADVDSEHLLRVLLAELPLTRAVAVATEVTGAKRNEIYATALKLTRDR